MKKRMGFVSNSSSSSFICDLTGQSESGWDCCLSDVDFVECVKGHTFSYDGYPEVEAWVNASGDDEDVKEECGGYTHNVESNYNMPVRLCPICQKEEKAMKTIADRLKNEMKHLGITVEDLKL